MKHLLILLLFASCSTPEKCNDKCGKIIDTHYFKESNTVSLQYVTQCGDSITKTLKIDYSDYLENYRVNYKYCDK